jgi:hypothetical protein
VVFLNAPTDGVPKVLEALQTRFWHFWHFITLGFKCNPMRKRIALWETVHEEGWE